MGHYQADDSHLVQETGVGVKEYIVRIWTRSHLNDTEEVLEFWDNFLEVDFPHHAISLEEKATVVDVKVYPLNPTDQSDIEEEE